MKKISILLFSIIILVSCGTKTDNSSNGNITISVQIEGLNQGKVVLEQLTISERIPIDTIDIKEDGSAELKFNGNEINIYLLKLLDQQGEVIFVAKKGDEVKITANAKNIAGTFRISGNKELEKLDEFILNDRNFASYRDSLNKIYLSLKERNEHFTVEEQYNALYKNKAIAYENYVKSYLDKNPEFFSNILTIRSLDINRFAIYYEKVLKSLNQNYPNSEHVIAFNKDLEKVFATELGGKASGFELPSIDGKTVKLSDFKGKYVLLDFWATWCKPCIAEIPNLKNVYKQFGNKNFEIVSVCIDRAEFKPTWEKIIKEYKTNWTQLFDASGQTAESYSIEYFPTIILLDPKGNIIAKNIRGEEISAKVKQVLGK